MFGLKLTALSESVTKKGISVIPTVVAMANKKLTINIVSIF